MYDETIELYEEASIGPQKTSKHILILNNEPALFFMTSEGTRSEIPLNTEVQVNLIKRKEFEVLSLDHKRVYKLISEHAL